VKAAFVAVTTAAIRCRQHVENQVVGHVDAVATWGMLNSLAILAWLEAVLRNEFAEGPKGPFADRAQGMKMALRSRMDAMLLDTRFSAFLHP